MRRRCRGAPSSQRAKSGSGRNHGYRRCCPAVGRLQIGYLRGREPLQPKTSTKICGLSKKRKNEEPSTGTPSKNPRTVPSSTRPIITMILHMGKKKHQIRVLPDTGCFVMRLNRQWRNSRLRRKRIGNLTALRITLGKASKEQDNFIQSQCSSNTEDTIPRRNSKFHQWRQISTLSSLVTG